jgi:hypothetical protein
LGGAEYGVQIKLKGSNLDLFKSQQMSSSEFEVNSFEAFVDLIPLVLDSFYVLKCRYIQELRSLCNKNLKKISARTKIEKNYPEIELFQRFEDSFFEMVPNRDNFFHDVNKLITQIYGEKVKLISWHQATSFKQNIIDFSIPELEENYIYWDEDVNPILCYHFINVIYKLKYKESTYDKKLLNCKEILKSITIPFVFYDSLKVPLLYNQDFTNLNISVAECYDFLSGEIIQNNDFKYKILKTQGDSDSTLCLFLGHESVDFNRSYTDELGIITSSIAHELNNPLAGILAALDVLLLDDLEEETLAELIEMKDGVSRARKLVMTFLGFSKNDNDNTGTDGNLKDSFIQSIELTRARLIENNLKLEYQFSGQDPTNIKVSESFMTMLFYLLIGEMVTVLQRKALVQNQKSDRIEITVHLEEKKISLLFPNSDETYARCRESKLFTYLLNSLDFTLNTSDHQLVFIRN